MPSSDELEAAKARVSQKYMGTAGIHSVGVRRGQSAVTVYVEPGQDPVLDDVLAAIREDIQPFNLLVMREGRAFKG